MKYHWLFTWCLMVCPVFSEPLFITKSNNWDQDSKLIIEGCLIKNSLIQVLNPDPKWNKNSKWLDLVYVDPPRSPIFNLLHQYEEFKTKNQARETMVYGLANEGVLGKGVLYQFDMTTGQTVTHFILPIKVDVGTLLCSDVYDGDQWHSILVLTATNHQEGSSILMVFDVTEPRQKLQPSLSYDEKTLLMINLKPKIVRLMNGNFGIVVLGHQNNKAILHIILLDEAKTLIPTVLNTRAVSTVLAVDLNQKGVVDKIYLADTEHLFSLDLSQVYNIQSKQLLAIKNLKSLLAVPNESKAGIRLYFIAEILGTQGIFSLEMENEFDRGALLFQPQLVIKGEYDNLFLRFGRLIAIPKLEKEDPVVLTVSNGQRLKATKRPMVPYTSLVTENTFVHASRIGWDIKSQQEVLFILNSSCQLNIYCLEMKESLYGRTAWRKIKKY